MYHFFSDELPIYSFAGANHNAKQKIAPVDQMKSPMYWCIQWQLLHSVVKTQTNEEEKTLILIQVHEFHSVLENYLIGNEVCQFRGNLNNFEYQYYMYLIIKKMPKRRLLHMNYMGLRLSVSTAIYASKSTQVMLRAWMVLQPRLNSTTQIDLWTSYCVLVFKNFIILHHGYF